MIRLLEDRKDRVKCQQQKAIDLKCTTTRDGLFGTKVRSTRPRQQQPPEVAKVVIVVPSIYDSDSESSLEARPVLRCSGRRAKEGTRSQCSREVRRGGKGKDEEDLKQEVGRSKGRDGTTTARHGGKSDLSSKRRGVLPSSHGSAGFGLHSLKSST